MVIQQLITSFIAAASFGVLFNVPKNRLIQGGISGAVGWISYFLLVGKGVQFRCGIINGIYYYWHHRSSICENL